MRPEPPELRAPEPRRRPATRPRTGRILALLAIVFVLGLLLGRVLLSAPTTPDPVIATQDISIVTVTAGAETVTVTK